jgi:hypothetical protein
MSGPILDVLIRYAEIQRSNAELERDKATERLASGPASDHTANIVAQTFYQLRMKDFDDEIEFLKANNDVA